MENIGLVYADFKREYDIDLQEEAYTLKWSIFLILLKGLSAKSRTVQTQVYSKEELQDTSGLKEALMDYLN